MIVLSPISNTYFIDDRYTNTDTTRTIFSNKILTRRVDLCSISMSE